MNFQTASLKTEAANITQPEYFIYAKKLLAEDVLASKTENAVITTTSRKKTTVHTRFQVLKTN